MSDIPHIQIPEGSECQEASPKSNHFYIGNYVLNSLGEVNV